MNLFNNILRGFTRHNLAKHSAEVRSVPRSSIDSRRGIFGYLGKLSSLHVQPLDFCLLFSRFINLDSSVFLLVQQQDSLKHRVKIDLEQLVSLIDELFEFIRDFESLGVGRDIRVDKDRVGVPIDNLMSATFPNVTQGDKMLRTSSESDSASSRV